MCCTGTFCSIPDRKLRLARLVAFLKLDKTVISNWTKLQSGFLALVLIMFSFRSYSITEIVDVKPEPDILKSKSNFIFLLFQ